MDSTPIYTELRNTLADPEDRDWGPSAPPEFAVGLDEGAESAPASAPAKESRTSGARSRARRHRAAD
ncbi:hypothetical protein SAMN05660874_01369 [Saccharopolyspora flava]|uniref:Uncharacterized protein n=1 Tax=Saccharopolyspora flava TaxID=95161 RepID=A0A1I6QE71_9PSEU|nr:hypothetical protein SAMN05660874_01369 [Saccharopolyspora flava]